MEKKLRRATSRREFLRDAAFTGGVFAALGLAPLRSPRIADAQTAGAVPGWLEDPTPGQGDFEYSLPLNPYEAPGADGIRTLFAKAEEACANSVAMGVHWPTVQPGGRDDALNLGPVDQAVREAEARGMKVSLFIDATPDWVHPDLRNSTPDPVHRQHTPPVRNGQELALFEEFVGKVAARYGTRVARYQIWNEPNIPVFFRPYTQAQSAGVYPALLRAGWRAVKARAGSSAIVTFGGLGWNHDDWLQGFYDAARAQFPDALQSGFFFDELALHCYTGGPSPEYTGPPAPTPYSTGIRGIPRMRAVMDRNGDPDKEVLVGEFGYPTSGGWAVSPVDDSVRALFLKQAYARAREMPYVKGLVWYAFHPTPVYPSPTGLNDMWTLLDGDLRPNRTFQAHREATGWNRSVKCYPKPPAGALAGAWAVEPVYEGGGAPSDVYRYELFVDGVSKAQSATAPFSFDTRGIANGRHGFVLAAYTRSGSVYSAMPLSAEVMNSTPPTVTDLRPANGGSTTDRTPLIAATVRDRETPIPRENVTLHIDGRRYTNFVYTATGRLRIEPRLGPGRHAVRVEARDPQGLVGSRRWIFYVR